MIIVILLSCFTTMMSAIPVRPNVFPSFRSRGGVTQAQTVQPVEATNQEPDDAHTPAPLSPKVEQPQPGVPQQLGPQLGPQFLPHTQLYTWYPVGGSPMIVPLQPSVHGSQLANQQPTLPQQQQPLIFPPYAYFPLFSSPYTNQLLSPYGFPMIPQTNQPVNSPVLPAETPSGAAPSGAAPQLIQQQQQQQQNPQIVYMIQQPMSSPVGSLSSEELEMAAELGQLGVYLNAVLTNPSAGAVQPVNQAAGLTNPEEQDIAPTVETSSTGVPAMQGLDSSSPQPNTNGVPAGLEGPTQEAATVQTHVQPGLEPTQGNLVQDCSHQQRKN